MSVEKLDVPVRRGDFCEVFMQVFDMIYDEGSQTWIKGPAFNLTGYQVTSWIKEKVTDTQAAAVWTIQKADQTLTPGGVLLSLSPEQTASLTKDKYLYDVQVASGPGDIETYFEGEIIMSNEITPASAFNFGN